MAGISPRNGAFPPTDGLRFGGRQSSKAGDTHSRAEVLLPGPSDASRQLSPAASKGTVTGGGSTKLVGFRGLFNAPCALPSSIFRLPTPKLTLPTDPACRYLFWRLRADAHCGAQTGPVDPHRPGAGRGNRQSPTPAAPQIRSSPPSPFRVPGVRPRLVVAAMWTLHAWPFQ